MAHTVYAVASGKGGVGKTATTVNLGAALAERGYTVAIVDADLGMANLGGFLGLDLDGPTLHEVLAGEESLRNAVYEIDAGLAAVPSGISLDGFAAVETEALSDAIDGLRESFDYVLLDLGAGLSHDTVLPLALADAVVLVSTPKPVALQDTAKTHQVTERLGGAVAGVVLTRATDPGELDVDAVAERLGLPILAVIPEDDAVDRSALAGDPVVATDPETPATAGFHGLADIVIAESLEKAPVIPPAPEPEPGTAEPGADDAEATESESTPDEPPATEASTDPDERSTAGEGAATDEQPASGEQSAADAQPETDEQPAVGEDPATDEQPATGEAGTETDTEAPADADGGATTDDEPMDAIDDLAEVGDESAMPAEEPTDEAGPAAPDDQAAEPGSAEQTGADRDELVGMDVDVDTAAEEIAAAMETDTEGDGPAADPGESGVRFDDVASEDHVADAAGEDYAADDPGTPDRRAEPAPGPGEREPPGAQPPRPAGEQPPAEGPPGGNQPPAGQEPPVGEQPPAEGPPPDHPEGPVGEGEPPPFAVEGAEPDDEDEDEDSGGLLSRLFGFG